MIIDLAFPFGQVGRRLPLDHGFTLFSALSKRAEKLHTSPQWSMSLVTAGERLPGGGILLTERSSLRLRLPSEDLGEACCLLGYEFEIFDQKFGLGDPCIHPLRPASALFCPLVVCSGVWEATAFHSRVVELIQRVTSTSPEVRLGRSRRMRVHGAVHDGFSVWVDGLGDTASIELQAGGVGGRRHMGAGFFLPCSDVL